MLGGNRAPARARLRTSPPDGTRAEAPPRCWEAIARRRAAGSVPPRRTRRARGPLAWVEPVQGDGGAGQDPPPSLDALVPGEEAGGGEIRERHGEGLTVAGRCDEVELGEPAGIGGVEQLAPGTQTQGLPQGAG